MNDGRGMLAFQAAIMFCGAAACLTFGSFGYVAAFGMAVVGVEFVWRAVRAKQGPGRKQ